MMSKETNWIIYSEEISNPDYGTYPGSRTVEENLKNGFLILDKPSGPTSRQCISWVKGILGIDKAGHSGTLDPRTTGVLLILLGAGTKVMPALKNLDKTYVTVMHVHKDVDDERIEKVVKKFMGEIRQKPPVRSAVARKRRRRKIYEIKILDRIGKDRLLRIKCEAGTYVRKLIHDIGKHIGGAHMKELRRISAGRFTEEQAHTFQDIKDAFVFWQQGNEEGIRKIILPLEASVEHIGKVVVKDSAVNPICHGSPLYTGGIARIEKNIKKDELVAMITGKGELVAIGQIMFDSNQLPKKALIVKTDRVVMDKDVYPRIKN